MLEHSLCRGLRSLMLCNIFFQLSWKPKRHHFARKVKQRTPGPSVSCFFMNVRMIILFFSKNNCSQFFPGKLPVLRMGLDGFQNGMFFLNTRVLCIFVCTNVYKCHKRVKRSAIIFLMFWFFKARFMRTIRKWWRLVEEVLHQHIEVS